MQNKLLARQIKRSLKNLEIPEQFVALFQAISDSYDHYEADRQMLERSLEISSQELTTAYQTLEEKSKQIEEINKNITDSIRYAKRIQEAILPSPSRMKIMLGDHFVVYKPKDIVSGDFFYVHQKGNWVFLSTADCTGHGVPGAFMSLLNTNFLNDALSDEKNERPHEILNSVRSHIIDALKVRTTHDTGRAGITSGMTMQDGMDCVLCAFDFDTRKFLAACANNVVWIVKSNGEFIELEPDKFPVGRHDHEKVPFRLHELQLEEGDAVYTFTDGYADQFGGPHGKKFKYKPLKELIQTISFKPMEEQRDILDSTIENWKKGYEQIDDILVIGVRV